MKNLLLILILVFAVSAFDCDKSNASVQTTPKGARIESDSPVDADRLSVIDQALTEVFSDAAHLGYTERLTHGAYTIFVNRNCQPRNGVMVWLGRADNYDGSEYDQNPAPGIGEIFIAEQVGKVNNQIVPRYIICFDSFENIAQTTRYGAEHIILAANDLNEYRRTETHSNGAGHPIIPPAQ